MSYADQQYHTLLQELVDMADSTPATNNRTDTDAFTLFGRQMRFDLSQGFPLLTTKKVHFNSVLTELLWFLKGDTNIKYLLEHNNHIWTDWRYKEYLEYCKAKGFNECSKETFETMVTTDKSFAEMWGGIGKGYGHQWRNFGEVQNYRDHGIASSFNPKNHKFVKGFDQISWVINEIKTNPKSRRLIVSGWNPHEVDKVDLPPCHTLFQFHVAPLLEQERLEMLSQKAIKEKWQSNETDRTQEEWLGLCDDYGIPRNKLSCQLYQRSADVFLGVPFNIASYALLTQMIAQVCGLGLGEFIWTGGNVHLYENHITQAKDQLVRNPTWHECPKLTIDTEGKTIFEITEEDVHLEDYAHFPPIKAPVAV